MSLRKASASLVSRSSVGFTPTGGGAAVTISNVIITDSNWNNLDDTAISTLTSYIKIIGSGFAVNPKVYIGTTQISSGDITFVSSTELRVIIPSQTLGNKNLFVFNANDSGAIWVPGLLVSGTPDFTQTSYVTTTPLSVSVQLLAIGDAPLVYSLQSGSTLPAGLSLSSSGLITGSTTSGIYQFTIIVNDAQFQSFQTTITLTIVSTDDYFNRTTLAINADTNSFVTDLSSNNLLVTVNGDTKPSAFSPYNTDWSNYFDGTGDYLSTPAGLNTAIGGYAGSTWTLETWFYAESVSATTNFSIIGGYQAVAVNGRWYLGYSSFNSNTQLKIKFAYTIGTGSQVDLDSTNAFELNRWHHIAVTIDATTASTSTIKFFVNGVLENTFTNQNLSTHTSNYQSPSIGGNSAAGSIRGYISNLRMVKGSLVYTSNFTPSTSALTAITNTILLTCQSNTFKDNSTNNFVITRNGDVKVASFGPFIETDVTTGSGYFDGTNDNLLISSSSSLDLPADFTIECWVNFSALGTNRIIIDRWSSGVNGGWQLYWRGTGTSITFFFNTAVVAQDPSTTRIQLNNWYHIAAVRSGTTCSLYINGEFVASGTLSLPLSPANIPLCIGEQYSTLTNDFSGYISNVRIVNSALYTTNFIPPTAPLTAVANTVLLTLQNRNGVNNHSFVDISGNNNLLTRTGNTSQGSFSPYTPSGWSVFFDGSGDTLTLSRTVLTDLSAASAWTIEFWAYKTATSAAAYSLIMSTDASGNSNGSVFSLNNTNFVVGGQGHAGFPQLSTPANSTSINRWHHIAVVKNSGTLKIYIDGVERASNVQSTTFPNVADLMLGNRSSGDLPFTGYISNLRVVNGTAVYTSAFTPPSADLTAITNTSLLMCKSNRVIDNSTNNFAITKNGDTKVLPFSPVPPTVSYSPDIHGGSAYFDGSDYLVIGQGFNTSLGTNNWTVEGWFYPTGTSTNQQIFWHYGNTIDNISIYINASTGVITAEYRATNLTGATTAGTSTRAKPGQWTHVAMVRDSATTIKLYVNGVLDATITIGATASFNETTLATLRYGSRSNPDQNYFTGYLSDWRFTKGRAVYTGAFTPPTSLLPLAADTVHQLRFNNAAIVDVSSRHVIETVADARLVTSTKKFGTGSMYFDGTGDVILCTNTAESFGFGTGDFTIECWANLVNYSSERPIFYKFVTWATNADFAFRVDGSTGLVRFLAGDSTPINIASNAAIPLNQWVHLAVTRASGVTKIFVNGTQQTATHTGSVSIPNDSKTLIIGGDAVSPTVAWNGYIDDLRITSGYARYTANFTPAEFTFLTR